MKIRSTKELIYDSRNNEEAILEIEVTEWNYNALTGTYVVCVKDSIVEMIIPEPIEGEESQEPYEVVKQFNVKTRAFSKEEIDGLFVALNSSVDLDAPYSEQLDDMISRALLLITQQTPIYGSEATDWVVS